MYPRTQYEMTEQDLAELLESMKPVPMIMLQCGTPSSQQENANRAWARLGEKMGFDSMTVQPTGRGDRFFSAIPSETEEHKARRLEKEAEEKRLREIDTLTQEIAERQERLKTLTTSTHPKGGTD